MSLAGELLVMIGGGELSSFRDGAPLDQELFVRFAQCSALFPMMQFSLAPWRVLDERHLSAVKAAVDTHQTLQPDLSALFDHGFLGFGVIVPAIKGFDVHRRELPAPYGVDLTDSKPSALLLLGDRKP